MAKENEGDSATSTAVEEAPKATEASRSITSLGDLTNLFDSSLAKDVVQEEEVQTTEQKEETEENQEVKETEVTEGTVKTEESSTDETETKEDQQEDPKDVLSHEKAIRKLKKRVDKTTKNWKTAEEENEAQAALIEKLQRQVKEATFAAPGDSNHKTFAEIAQQSDSPQELNDLFEKAEKAEQWADDMLDNLRDSGEDTIEVGGVTYGKSQIKDLQKDARLAIKKAIPAQEQFFQQREQFDQKALQDFDFLKDEESEIFKATSIMMENPEFNSFINHLPEGSYLLGIIGEGIRSTEARLKEEPAKGEEEPAKAKEKPKAPLVPGLESTPTPRRVSSDEQKQKSKDAIRQKPVLGKNDLMKLFS